MSFLTLDKVNIHYTDAGSGRVIVLLHGWGASKKSFAALQKFLATDYRTIALDLPGFGESTTPPVAWSLKDYANAVNTCITMLGVTDYVLAGHSFGGRIALLLAATKPGHSKGVILMAAAGIKHMPTPTQQVAGLLTRAGKRVFSFPLLKHMQKPARSLLYRALGKRDYYEAQGVMKETMRLVIEEDLRDCLSRITLPTLIIWGERDDYTPVEDAHTLHQGIKGSTLHIIPGASHYLPRKYPEALAQAIRPFLSQL